MGYEAMRVTIQDLGSIGELIAAIATVITLVYLALQIRANSNAIRAESRRATSASGSAIRAAIAQDGELARIFNVGLADYSSLGQEEKTRFNFVMADFLTQALGVYEEVSLGIQSELDFAYQRAIIAPFLRTPGGREFWRRYANRYPPPFMHWVNREIFNDQGDVRHNTPAA